MSIQAALADPGNMAPIPRGPWQNRVSEWGSETVISNTKRFLSHYHNEISLVGLASTEYRV